MTPEEKKDDESAFEYEGEGNGCFMIIVIAIICFTIIEVVRIIYK